MDIRFEQVDFTYQPNTPFEQRALFDINMTIKENSYTALVGHTGSGKSTLLQHLNALVKPTSGTVHIGERDIQPDTDNKNLKPIRKKVGITVMPTKASKMTSVLKTLVSVKKKR